MSAPEPIPPTPATESPANEQSRTLHTMMQPPREARWSRPSSVIISVLFHLALFLGIRQLVWVKPTVDSGPVFQIFNLSQPKEVHVPIATPVITPPVTKKDDEMLKREQAIVRASPPPAASAPAPALTQPVTIPTNIPPQGTAVVEPNLTPGRNQGQAPPRTAAERLLRSGTTPGTSLTAPERPPAPLTPQEMAAARMANGIRGINDSMAAAVAAANSATDWTKTDKNGKKWGVTPGQLHLGSITLPLPFYFNPPPGRREDAAKSARIFAESNAQAKRMEMEETFESRVKAMRKRKDAARDSAKAHGGGS